MLGQVRAVLKTTAFVQVMTHALAAFAKQSMKRLLAPPIIRKACAQVVKLAFAVCATWMIPSLVQSLI
tara:strand:- start:284 stop:487 length:204 start_codon:yes stop_codon:yes gene_type:complete